MRLIILKHVYIDDKHDDCLFVCLGVLCHSGTFHSFGDVNITGDRVKAYLTNQKEVYTFNLSEVAYCILLSNVCDTIRFIFYECKS